MTALAADFNRGRAGAQYPDSPVKMGVKGSTTIYAGSLAVNNAGVAAPATTATGLLVLGVARKQYANSGADNAITGEFDIGDHWFANSASGDLIAAADIGNDCWIVDDNTVAKTNGSSSRSRAGKIIDVDSTLGVLVRVGVGF